MKNLVDHGKVVAEVHGAPDRAALLAIAQERLRTAGPGTRASWQRQVDALLQEDGRTFIDVPAEVGADATEALVAAVKAEAERRILAVYPYHKQANVTREAVASGDNAALSEMHAFIDRVRAACSAIIAGEDPRIADNPLWGDKARMS